MSVRPYAILLIALAPVVGVSWLTLPTLAQTLPAAPAAAAQDAKAKPDEDPDFQGMKYRLIGPFRGGRSLTAAGIPGDPTTYYFGATGGGVWKSTDGAMTWTPVFDHEGVGAIGSLAVAPSDPNVLYVGTGEAAIRGNISHGDGVYKSVDGGKTWKNAGLRDTRAIGKVIVDPHDSNIAFVAALGHVYGPNVERGVFRTLDGGQTWKKVLYKDDKTGAIDIAFDPNNSHILFAALWQAYRTPYSLSSGGPGSGIYRSGDGGSTWKEVKGDGLPEPPYGKIGLAVAANSSRVYALIEAAKGGLYRSDDGGENWQLVDGDRALWQRAWYYMNVIPDPVNPDVVYNMNVEFLKSTDGGRSFNKIQVPHGDNHNLWIDPQDTHRMITADDGGVSVTLDGGKNWTLENNQPTAQFYHVTTDDRFPYYVYGSQQDNTTVAIASRSDHGAIDDTNWYPVGGGEAGYIAPSPLDPDIVYAGDYEGTLTRFDKHTGQTQSISPWPEITDGEGAAYLEHRFQWTAPLLISPHDPHVLYHAGERLFKSTDGGAHWEIISPDLTRNDKSKQENSGGPITKDDTGTEYYDTIFAVAESPLTAGLIWAGSDDGLIHLTRDGGKHWTDVTPKQMPEWSRVSLIDASPFDAGTAWVAVDRHQNDDLRPYIYVTADYGKSWKKIVTGIPDNTFVRAVREDPKRRGLLYAGTETGIWVSLDGGAHWRPLKLNLPTTPVHDLVVKGDDLVVATHGRSFWILDDITPLREFNESFSNSAFHLYTPAPALRIRRDDPTPPSRLTGSNPPAGAIIDYFVKTKPKKVTIEILDATGAVIRRYSSEKTKDLDEPLDPDAERPKKEIEPKAGLNRFAWDLRYENIARPANYFLYDYQSGARGQLALPGHYHVRVTADGATATVPLEVKPDPRVKTPLSDLEKQFQLVNDIQRQLTYVYQTVDQIRDVRNQIKQLGERLGDTESGRRVRTEGADLDAKLAAVESTLIDLRITASEDSLNHPFGLDGKLAALASTVGDGADAAPTDQDYQVFALLKKRVGAELEDWTALKVKGLAAFGQTTTGLNIKAITVPEAPVAKPLQDVPAAAEQR